MVVIGEKDILGYSKRSRSGLFHAFYEAELQVSEEKKLVPFKTCQRHTRPKTLSALT